MEAALTPRPHISAGNPTVTTAAVRSFNQIDIDRRASILLVRTDNDAWTMGLRARITGLIEMLIPVPNGAFTFDSRTIAVPLGKRDAAAESFLAERIRLTVAAMPSALSAPTVTVAIANADQLRTAGLGEMWHGRNRVIRFSCAR